MKKAAIFDMDGLMFDTERISLVIWKQVAQKMNFSLSEEQCASFRGSNKEFKRQLFRKWYGDAVDYDKAYQMRQNLMTEYLKIMPPHSRDFSRVRFTVPIEDCLVFEDSPNGLHAASRAGAVVVMVPDMEQPNDKIREICDYIFEDLSQAIRIL